MLFLFLQGRADPVFHPMCFCDHHLLQHRPTARNNYSVFDRLGRHHTYLSLPSILPAGNFRNAESSRQFGAFDSDGCHLFSMHRGNARDKPYVCRKESFELRGILLFNRSIHMEPQN